jgi:hypothetical protein
MKTPLALMLLCAVAVSFTACDRRAVTPSPRKEAPTGLTAAQLATNTAMAARERAFAAAASAASASAALSVRP